MRVVVGSNNPVKIAAVREIFQRAFGAVKVVGREVDSGVSSQPFNEELIEGSMKRAKEALNVAGTDFAVGIEGGVIRLGERWYNLGFVTIIDKKGIAGTGTSGWFECPPSILDELRKGKELGEVIDELTGIRDTKKGEGAIGFFTRGMVSRKDLYKHAILMALAPFLSPNTSRPKMSY